MKIIEEKMKSREKQKKTHYVDEIKNSIGWLFIFK